MYCVPPGKIDYFVITQIDYGFVAGESCMPYVINFFNYDFKKLVSTKPNKTSQHSFVNFLVPFHTDLVELFLILKFIKINFINLFEVQNAGHFQYWAGRPDNTQDCGTCPAQSRTSGKPS